MITPRRTRLVRVADLRDFRRAIALLAQGAPNPEPILVVVPSRGAGDQLRRTLAAAGSTAAAEPVDREQLYDRFHERLNDPPARLNAFERNALVQASAHHARGVVTDLPFRLRPGLIAEMLGFYDLLRRQSQVVERFEELVEQQLIGHTGADPGADRLLQQTRFLAEAFREYERRLASANAVDEHSLRARLIAAPASRPIRHVIVAVPDWIADPDGLFVADFDLLSRIAGLDAIEIVATESLLGSGFHERLHTWLPGIEEVSIPPAPPVRPVLAVPEPVEGVAVERMWFTYRDRDEELIAVARDIARREIPSPSIDRAAVVFRRPLPYLYLAEDTLGAAGIPYQLSNALPLAAEPLAAALDLVFDLVASDYSRAAIVALLRSPHLAFDVDFRESNTLDRLMSDERYLGGVARLEEIAAAKSATPGLARALSIVRELEPLAHPHPASGQLRRLSAFFESHARALADADPFAGRERRARAAILDGLARLAAAHEAHHDPAWAIDDLAGAVRRWIEGETFVPEASGRGVHLLDDQAARFGAFDDITVVGLVEGEWPDRPRRNIFYSSSLMKALGWPSEKDRRAAEEARFIDLISSASRRVALSTITLDDEALVEPSSLLDEVPRARLSSATEPLEPIARDPLATTIFTEDARAWVGARSNRTAPDDPSFHGAAGPRPPRAWSISALETYVGCPFKFFAQYVLRLEEEPDDEEVMDPRRQGLFVHDVFEQFFRAWQAKGGGAITPSNIEDARALFAATVDELVGRLPPTEAGLERTRLLGSPAAAGLGEAVLRMEAERPVQVIERLLEHDLTGPLTIQTASGARVVQIRGKADRLDLLADGTFRLIDYKLGWPPQRTKALQLPIYSLSAEQQLSRTRNQTWSVGEAVYLAFKGPRRVVPLFTTDADRAEILSKAQARIADAIDRIERGEFPPTPDDVYRCETCSFAAVCRKDYVGDV